MIMLKDIKVENKKDLKSELLVLGRFKQTKAKNLISILSSLDKDKVSEAMSIDLSEGQAGDYLLVSGSSSYKRIMIYNLGDKDKLTNDKMREFGSKLYSLVNSKKVKSMTMDTKSFSMTANDRIQSAVEGLVLGSYLFDDYKSKKSNWNWP